MISPINLIFADQLSQLVKINFSVNLYLLFLVLSLSSASLYSQEIPQSVSNTGIYEFLDELANNQIISINSAVKPYSRLFIAERLKEASEKRDQLSARQSKELDFYLLDFGKELKNGITVQRYNGTTVQRYNGERAQWLKGKKGERRWDLFYYKDSLFSLTVNPILGGELIYKFVR